MHDDERGEPKRREAPPEWKPISAAGRWFANKDAAALDMLERDGRFYYDDCVERVEPGTGERKEIRVRVGAPTHHEKMKARIDALDIVKRLAKLSSRPTMEEAEKLIGSGYFDQVDTICLLARCIRDHDDPAHQYMTPEDLDHYHSAGSLSALWERLNWYANREDPQLEEVDETTFWDMLRAIDKRRDCSPLLVIAGRARDTFIVSMASRLLSSAMPKS
jgi:hypothetical protein